jgi:hypothetical protein
MSRTGNGAVIALNAIGKQDEILYDLENYNEEESPFHKEPEQFSHYTKFYRSNTVYPDTTSPSWPFTGDGRKIGFVIDPRTSGDLLTGAYLSLDLPGLSDGVWTDKIGRALIQSVEFWVNSTLIERLTDIELVVKDELFTTSRDKVVKNYLQNGRLYSDTFTDNDFFAHPPVLPLSPVHNNSPLNLTLDLGFFFNNNKNYKPNPFPLIAVNKQLIYINIQFRPQTWFTNQTGYIGAKKLTLVTEQISLTEQERMYMRTKSITTDYKNLKTLFTVQTDSDNNDSISKSTTQLKNPSEKISVICWCFQNRRFKNTSNPDSFLFLNRFNFSAHENINIVNPFETGYVEPYYGFREVNFPICSQIELLYSKNDIRLLYSESDNLTIPSTSVFFRNISSQSRGLATPDKNIFSYTWDENPMNPQPAETETDNLSDYKLLTTLIDSDAVRDELYDLHIFGMYSFKLLFENGFLIKKM